MGIKVEIGHNVRHWTTFEVEHPTPDEAAVLMGEDEGAILALLERLGDEDRLVWVAETDDDNATYFTEGDQPGVIGVTNEEA